MKKKDKIIILKAKIIKLKEQLKSARLELADRDNELDLLKGIDNKGSDLFKSYHKNIVDLSSSPSYDEVVVKSNPIESTQELFEKQIPTYEVIPDSGGVDKIVFTDKPQRPFVTFIDAPSYQKGRVYNDNYGTKCYAIGITDKDQIVLWSDVISEAKIFNSFDEFKKEYEGMLPEYITPIFEPITPPLTPPTK